jgi:DNA-directed RNA polymerase subunit E'/Rpb7
MSYDPHANAFVSADEDVKIEKSAEVRLRITGIRFDTAEIVHNFIQSRLLSKIEIIFQLKSFFTTFVSNNNNNTQHITHNSSQTSV